MKRVPCEQCPIHTACVVGDLSAEAMEELRASSLPAIYRRRQVIFHEATPANGLYVLCHGAVKLFQSDRFGRDHILGVAGPGEVLSELPLDGGETYSVSAEALGDSQVCYLPGERLVQLIQRYPMVGVRLIAALSRSLATARRKVRELALKRAEGRLAELLLQLARVGNGAAEGKRVLLAYSRRELAEMIGVSTETAIRLLGKLKQKRIIVTDHRDLVITDPEKLARLASHESAA